MQPLVAGARGAIPIVPTPFDEDGSLLLADFDRLIDYYAAAGVAGLAILGVAGEADKLTTEETLTVVDYVLKQARDRLPVLVGVTNPTLSWTVELALHACERGANGVILQPLAGLKEPGLIQDYFARFVDRTGGRAPLCIQDFPGGDFPGGSGVHMSVATLAAISRLDPVFMLKHEAPAGLQKLSSLVAARASGETGPLSIMASNNALHFAQELARGADGAISGVAYSDVLVEICRLYWAGEVEQALNLNDAALPLFRHEAQGRFGHSVRKAFLVRRGALTHDVCRYPGVTLGATENTELDQLVTRFEHRARELGFNPTISF